MQLENFSYPNDQYCTLGKNTWSVDRLIQLSKDFKVFKIPVDGLNVYTKYDITLRQLVAHIKAVQKADLKFPIILDEDGEILDGRHRIMKAILEGKSYVLAVRFGLNPTPCKREED